MAKDFQQLDWGPQLEDDCRALIRLAVREDLDRFHDLTTNCLVPPESLGRAEVRVRAAGVIAGMPVVGLVLDEMDLHASWKPLVTDGQRVAAGTVLGELSGAARELLVAERPLLNFLSRLSGIATFTAAHVELLRGTRARLYDTRKTTPGYRRLEKYAVRQGGGCNHRTGLFDAILIKDNHLALGARGATNVRFTPAQAVAQARAFLRDHPPEAHQPPPLVEIEVDSLDQLREVLPAAPDIVLLDNMSPATLREAVGIRNALAPTVQLEASGGIHLGTIRDVAETGVERISCGALTHSAPILDIGLDWMADTGA